MEKRINLKKLWVDLRSKNQKDLERKKNRSDVGNNIEVYIKENTPLP